jgi:hypothetical protein
MFSKVPIAYQPQRRATYREEHYAEESFVCCGNQVLRVKDRSDNIRRDEI